MPLTAAGQSVEADFVVVGSGIAGLWFTYRVSDHGRVVLLTKKGDTDSSTNYAQGGIAAAFAEDDSPGQHFEDTMAAGAGLAHPDVVKVVTDAGPGLVQELARLGVAFTVYEDAHGQRRFDLGQEGGHHRRRIVHARDLTGLEIERGLLAAVRSRTRVTMLQQHLALDLVLGGSGSCCGVQVMLPDGGRRLVTAPACLLATGGIGQVYLHTTNPPIATGDGVAMAYRAGAAIANMEFIQFHPTALSGGAIEGRTFLISEALRGEGAVLRTRDGRTFMERYHTDASLAPRDVVARAIAAELARSGDEHVLLDATHLAPSRLRERFPNVYQTCLGFGIDITTRPIPVVPAAHYVCGGVLVDTWAQTSIPGLFAAGECACTGLHGANRLASNSLLEALVFAERAAQQALRVRAEAGSPELSAVAESGSRSTAGLRQRLRRLMWQDAGIVRSDAGLAAAATEIEALSARFGDPSAAGDPETAELGNLLTVARLVVGCARRRLESRGLHYNTDHPDRDERYAQDTVVTRQQFEAGR